MGEGVSVIYLVHHADAVGPEVEPQRPLSTAGRHHAERLATEAAARGVKPAAIWHSGKLRARQTAEPFLRLCNPLAEFTAIKGLQPSDSPGIIKDLLRGEAREVLLVGHMPSLPRLLTLLVTGDESSLLSFPLHGAIALEPAGERLVEPAGERLVEPASERWMERWRM